MIRGGITAAPIGAKDKFLSRSFRRFLTLGRRGQIKPQPQARGRSKIWDRGARPDKSSFESGLPTSEVQRQGRNIVRELADNRNSSGACPLAIEGVDRGRRLAGVSFISPGSQAVIGFTLPLLGGYWGCPEHARSRVCLILFGRAMQYLR